MKATKSITIELGIDDIEKAIMDFLMKSGYTPSNGYEFKNRKLNFIIDYDRDALRDPKLTGVEVSSAESQDGPIKPIIRDHVPRIAP